jgi:hypothetical protein
MTSIPMGSRLAGFGARVRAARNPQGGSSGWQAEQFVAGSPPFAIALVRARADTQRRRVDEHGLSRLQNLAAPVPREGR